MKKFPKLFAALLACAMALTLLTAQTVVVNGKVMSRSTMTFYPGYSGNGDYGFNAEYKIAADATTDIGIAVRSIGNSVYFIVAAARA